MTHIVQDLLTLSRFDSGRSELNLTRFHFDKAVRDTYQAVLFDAQKHAHTVRLEVPDGMPEVLADQERVMQVMMNIVSNAIKYTPDGGTIVLRAGTVGDRVWMEVDDNGIGIPDTDRTGSLSGSTGWIMPAPASPAGRGWGCPLPRKLWTSTRALSTW